LEWRGAEVKVGPYKLREVVGGEGALVSVLECQVECVVVGVVGGRGVDDDEGAGVDARGGRDGGGETEGERRRGKFGGLNYLSSMRWFQLVVLHA
jgi:hypothetical protein